jgi:hypothetical protein
MFGLFFTKWQNFAQSGRSGCHKNLKVFQCSAERNALKPKDGSRR